jgi:hypothetical protein
MEQHAGRLIVNTFFPFPFLFVNSFINHLAYVPLAERFQQWKNYRGGTVATI